MDENDSLEIIADVHIFLGYGMNIPLTSTIMREMIMRTGVKIVAGFFLTIAAALGAEHSTFVASYTSDSGHQPALIPIEAVDPARSIIRLEEGPQTTMHEVNLYFVKNEGVAERVKVQSYTYPVYQRFINNPHLLEQYTAIEVYYNGEKGSTPFNQGTINITLEERPFVEEVVHAPIAYSPDGKVEAAVFDMRDVEGADFIWVEMDVKEGVELMVRARNPESGLSKSIAGNQIGFFGGGMSRAYEKIYGSEPTGREAGILLETPLGLDEPGKFTKVEFSLQRYGEKSDSGNSGKVYVTSLGANERIAIAQSVQEKSEAYDAAWNITFWLWGIALVSGYLLTRLVYRSFAKPLAETRLLGFIPLTSLFAGAMIPLWYAVVKAVWLSPLVPGKDNANLYFMNTSALFFLSVVTFPMLLDRRYNICKKCKKYGTVTLGGRESSGGSTTTYTASNHKHTIVTGEDTKEFYNDQYVCTSCGHVKKQVFGIFSGRGRQDVEVLRNGRLATSDLISVGGLVNLMLTLSQPYNWYRFYKVIGLVR